MSTATSNSIENRRFSSVIADEGSAGLASSIDNSRKNDEGEDSALREFGFNAIGRNFYSRYGFEYVEEKFHQSTGQQLLRLGFSVTGQLRRARCV